MKVESSAMRNQQLDAKRKKTEDGQVVLDKTKQNTGKLIELDYVSSEEELWVSYVRPNFLDVEVPIWGGSIGQ